MIKLTPKMAKPHEAWCLNIALQVCGEVRKHESFRQHRTVDAILHMPNPVAHWGPLAGLLCRRDVLVEHFSNSVSLSDLGSCREKIGYASYRYFTTRIKNRTELHPSMVILSHRTPERVLKEPNMFEPTPHKGIWRWGSVECGPIFIVATTALEDTPEFEWMKMTTRLPQTPGEFDKAARLISENINDKIKPEDLEKTMFDFMYVDGVNVLTYAEEQKKAAEEQKKAAEEQKKAAEEQKKAAEEQRRFAEEVFRELQEARREIKALKAELKGTAESDD
ncbi:hypothetical protein FRD01_18070 [Microvenator marinus]|uniref:Uncharacterized protein n=1 Tax=Microvenator marinus TaxID=2600177 RepID=A0A5B8XVA0_9DELT|nr:hypothetical protein [Microvenator marinus]QED29111.1 hypothetical protein FRD01_18070 [Microvenator marinus]